MQFKLIVAVLAGLALAACETPQQSTNTNTSGGATTSAPSGGQTASTLPPANSGIVPGSGPDFVRIGDRVFFDFDRYDLTGKARTTLESQAIWLKQYPAVAVAVQGHADERGTREYNLALGARRANAVKNYLVALGVDARRLKTISFGKEVPFDPRSNEAAWAANRRSVSKPDPNTLARSATN